MNFAVVPTEEAHLRQVHQVIDAVAREGRYLAFTQAPPWEQSLAFYRGLIDGHCPYFVGLAGSQVVGWCDVTRQRGESRAHIGVLGMGLLPQARHQGFGRVLLQATLDRSWAAGFSRIVLSVRDDNRSARRLYERLGFQAEGLRRKASIVNGEVNDVWAMALLR